MQILNFLTALFLFLFFVILITIFICNSIFLNIIQFLINIFLQIQVKILIVIRKKILHLLK